MCSSSFDLFAVSWTLLSVCALKRQEGQSWNQLSHKSANVWSSPPNILMMIHMLTLTSGKSLSFLSAATNHLSLQCAPFLLLQTLNYSVPPAESIYVCVHPQYVYVWVGAIWWCVCVYGRQGIKEKVREWIVRVNKGCISIFSRAFAVKIHSTLGLIFFRMYEKQTWT